MQNKILSYLRNKSDYFSGDQISQRLGISRQALWKHIQELRDLGYEIVAVPHVGYRLESVPDRLFPSEIQYGLDTKYIGKTIYYFDQVSSTMDLSQNYGMQGSAHGTIIIAEGQSKGRGRMGREWHSPKYKGIYFSLILRPQVSANEAAVLTLLVAVSICETVRDCAGVTLQIKWPNDLFIEGKKVGGILTELDAELDAVRFVNIGVGLNVNNDRKSLIAAATSLKEIKGIALNRTLLLQDILRKIENNYRIFVKTGAGTIIAKWREYNTTLGKMVKVLNHGIEISGMAVDIDTDGGLLLRKGNGITIKLTAGDVLNS